MNVKLDTDPLEEPMHMRGPITQSPVVNLGWDDY